MSQPVIVVTNDDGITSNGIKNLVEVAKEFGKVLVVAPDKGQSGMGHAITIGQVLRLIPYYGFGEEVEAYQCTGTPADCVKFAKNHLLKDSPPDLVLSGINHGSNTSISVVYSGTMSAALEAAIDEMPAIGFSLCDYETSANMDHVLPHMRQIISSVLEKGITKGIALNVNFPALSNEPIKGIRVSRQAKASWEEIFAEREDPHGGKYFWLGGNFNNYDLSEDTDEWAVENNYTSVVPCHFDMTAYKDIDKLKAWDL